MGTFFMECKILKPTRGNQVCFYCDGQLPAKSQEHIFNATWGGSHKTSKLICDSCNQFFSEKIDLSFCRHTTTIMNARRLRGSRHSDIPSIDLGDRYIDSNGNLQYRAPIVHDISESGVILEFSSRAEARKYIRSSLIETYTDRPLTQDEIYELEKQIKNAPITVEQAQPQHISVNLDVVNQYKSAMHTCLKVLKLFSPDVLSKEQLSAASNFVRYGQGNYLRFSGEATLPISLANNILDLHHKIKSNSVEIYFCSLSHLVVGTLTILGDIRRSVILSETYQGQTMILYALEKLQNGGKPPNAVQIVFEPEAHCFPPVQFEFISDGFLFRLRDEARFLTLCQYPQDRLLSGFLDEIDNINAQHQLINQTLLNGYTRAISDFLMGLLKLKSVMEYGYYQPEIDESEIDLIFKKTTIAMQGMTPFSGKNCKDIKFQRELAERIISLMKSV